MSKSKGPPTNPSILQSMHLLVSTNFFKGLNCGLELPEDERVGGAGMSVVMNSLKQTGMWWL